MTYNVWGKPDKVAPFVACPQCGSEMKKSKTGMGNCAGIATGLLLVGVGGVLIVGLPGVGWIIGGILCAVGLLSGGKTQKVWRCKRCRSVVPRG